MAKLLFTNESPKQQPKLLFSKSNENEEHQQEQPGFWEKLGEGALNTTLGAGDALRDLISLGYTKGHPTSSGKAYEGGRLLGNIGGFIGGGELLEAAPVVSKVAEAFGKIPYGQIAKRMAGSGLFGAIENPEDRLQGYKQGLVSGAAGEALGVP